MRRVVARRRPIRILFALAAPTLVAIPIALLSMQWHQPTRMELTLTVDRLALTLAPALNGEGYATLLDYGRMWAVRIDRLARLTFAPASLEIADEARFDLKANGFPEEAWQPLAVAGEVALAPGPGSPRVAAGATLQASDPDQPGAIKAVRVAAGTEAVMELGSERDGKRPWLTLDLIAPRAVVF